ncbi:MAG: histidinol-phosphatase [Clostridia bacterium]|nr:histidinol-phosphatase [Clostridia bacterium]
MPVTRMQFNYHTHTSRCGHALGADREYVEAAIAAGLRQLGFADHSPMLYPEKASGYYSASKMRPEAFEEYAGSVFSLREEYKGRIELFLGVEIEYYPECFDKTERFLRDRGLEYMILGQHHTRNEYDRGAVFVREPHPEEDKVLTEYTDTVVKCIESGKFLYVAHPDIARYTGDGDFYRKQALRICEASLRHNVPLEVNLGAFRGGNRYPSPAFWKIAGEVGSPAIFGLDAHTPGEFTGIPETIDAFLKETAGFGINYVKEPLL